ncbi:hypothetical protein ElyMa_004665400 [Elysia marginata]|uniref:Uncharacterized protein n=1 Tax=Elysia marginata TaxID=1093978 RepID=A0AAV4I6X5_9GAST|nr:hypothetical protein ElyMa_004665400 [Elysia marginata]
MPPTIHIRLGGQGESPCNASTMPEGMCVISVQLTNMTLGGDDQGGSGLTPAQQDGQGAMRFIIAVLMVYSLMGTAGMLILRIRQSANKANTNKNLAVKEANHYLKYRDKINADCHRARLVKETSKVLHHIQALERQRSLPESLTSFNNEGSKGQLSPLLPPNLYLPTIPTQTSPISHVPLPPISEISQSSPLLGRPQSLHPPSSTFPLIHTAGVSDLDLQSSWLSPPQSPPISIHLTSTSTLKTEPVGPSFDTPPRVLTTPTATNVPSLVTPLSFTTTVASIEHAPDCDTAQTHPSHPEDSRQK